MHITVSPACCTKTCLGAYEYSGGLLTQQPTSAARDYVLFRWPTSQPVLVKLRQEKRRDRIWKKIKWTEEVEIEKGEIPGSISEACTYSILYGESLSQLRVILF